MNGRSLARGAAAVVAVVVAMALGQLVTDRIPVNGTDDKPFVRHGQVGQRVRLRYADITVTDVAATHVITRSSSGVAPAGTFLVLAVKVVARHKDDVFAGLDLVGADGVHYVASDRGAVCNASLQGDDGVPDYGMLCYDVPRGALRGMHLQFARGAYENDGAAQRRDDVADIDLGIDADKAKALWASTAPIRGQQQGWTPIDMTPPKVTD